MALRLGGLGEGARATVATRAAEFDRHLAPTSQQPHTRANNWRAWCLVVTWAVAHHAARDTLTMLLITLKLLWELLKLICFDRRLCASCALIRVA